MLNKINSLNHFQLTSSFDFFAVGSPGAVIFENFGFSDLADSELPVV
jgi:hypothetical protein